MSVYSTGVDHGLAVDLLSCIMMKSVFGVSDLVRQKTDWTEKGYGYGLEILELYKEENYTGKQRCLLAARLPQLISAPLFSHMHKAGFLLTWLN